MRLTNILYRGKRIQRDKLAYLRKVMWTRHDSVLFVDRLRVPERLTKEADNPTDSAEDMFRSSKYEDKLAEEINIGISPLAAKQWLAERAKKFALWSPRSNDPRYHASDQPSLMYTDNRRFSKGLDQASLLTNTAIFHGPPPCISPTIDQLARSSFEEDEDLRYDVERAIMHSHVWHTEETKLPRRFRPNLPIWKYKAEYGIHPSQVTRYLFHNLFRILDQQTPTLNTVLDIPEEQTSSDLISRWTTRDRLVETHFHWGDTQRRVGFAIQNDLCISGMHPSPLFVPDAEEITLLSTSQTPPTQALGPMSPLIDLESSLYYNEYDIDGWNTDRTLRSFTHPHLVTINLSLPSVWSDFLEPEAFPTSHSHRQAAALMHCFACALAHSHAMGDGHSSLNKPISIVGICSDGVYFDFVYYQLNVLKFPDLQSLNQSPLSDEARNLAWIDGPHRLFDKQIPKRSMLRNTVYRDLDMNVFSRIAAAYLWGSIGDQLALHHLDTERLSAA